ncbi:hypothetical protein HRbin26_01389 [bacterium HR26]|nr:hypothetical protein HRbin26_01389 [bacterium HR26]
MSTRIDCTYVSMRRGREIVKPDAFARQGLDSSGRSYQTPFPRIRQRLLYSTTAMPAVAGGAREGVLWRALPRIRRRNRPLSSG